MNGVHEIFRPQTVNELIRGIKQQCLYKYMYIVCDVPNSYIICLLVQRTRQSAGTDNYKIVEIVVNEWHTVLANAPLEGIGEGHENIVQKKGAYNSNVLNRLKSLLHQLQQSTLSNMLCLQYKYLCVNVAARLQLF